MIRGFLRHGDGEEGDELGPVWSEDISREEGLVNARVLVFAQVLAVFCWNVAIETHLCGFLCRGGAKERDIVVV